MSWEKVWERDNLANNAFWSRFDQEKAAGHSDEEAARRVLCGTHAKRQELTYKLDTGAISDSYYIDETAIETQIAVQACRMWDHERRKALEATT
jgi:hypothetical protein